MPRLSENTRAKRRQHILTSAWRCFCSDGFHATSIDDVIAATGMSSSAVYRYFRSKDELIDASAEEGLSLVRDIFTRLLATQPHPSPAQTLTEIVEELRSRTEHPDYDLTKLAIQTWAEALRSPSLSERTRALYSETHDKLGELATGWRAGGYLPPGADPGAVASVVVALMHGLLVSHHLGTDVSANALRAGLTSLGIALDNPAVEDDS